MRKTVVNQQAEIEINWANIKIAEIRISFPATEWGNLEQLFSSGGPVWSTQPFLDRIQAILQEYFDSKLRGLEPKISIKMASGGFEFVGAVTVLIGGFYLFIKDYPTLKQNFGMFFNDLKNIVGPYLSDLMKTEILNRIDEIEREKVREKSLFENIRSQLRNIFLEGDIEIIKRDIEIIKNKIHEMSFDELPEVSSDELRVLCDRRPVHLGVGRTLQSEKALDIAKKAMDIASQTESKTRPEANSHIQQSPFQS
jgi:hypothetical protein